MEKPFILVTDHYKGLTKKRNKRLNQPLICKLPVKSIRISVCGNGIKSFMIIAGSSIKFKLTFSIITSYISFN